MPNWCHNTLTVSGEEGPLRAFLAAGQVSEDYARRQYEEWRPRKDREPFEQFLAELRASQPIALAMLVPDEEAGDGWYEWRLEHWGTKWELAFEGGSFFAVGAETMDVEASEAARGMSGSPEAGALVFKFDTAWSPPVAGFLAVSEKHPELEFRLRFAEVGHDYAGEVLLVHGLTVNEEELQVNDVLSPEEMWY
jgi:hypothetical protein